MLTVRPTLDTAPGRGWSLSSQWQWQFSGMCRKMTCCTVKLFCTYSLWVGDEGVLVARLVWAMMTTKAVLPGGEARTLPFLRAALLEVPPSDLELCLVWCMEM